MHPNVPYVQHIQYFPHLLTMSKIIIIEDNEIIANNTAEFLRMEGYHVDVFHHGEKGFEEIKYAAGEGRAYDLAILDRMLPGLDGLSIARLITTKWIPTNFLFLTAKDKQIDINEGLEIGADDYLVKPFDLDELELRAKNILKRKRNSKNGPQYDSGTIDIGDITLDFEAHQVTQAENLIELSPKEYAIFAFLATNRWRVVTREQIFEEVWNDYGSGFSEASETINVHIAYLRRKIGKDTIRTVKGVWYVIDNS